MKEKTNSCLTASDEASLTAQAEIVFDLVCRVDFTGPGFCSIDAGSAMESHRLRSWMVTLKDRMSEIGDRRGMGPFAYRSMGHFDQQGTTKFHLDGAPDQSVLMLGYEPSNVRSRLYLADYTHAAFDLGITPRQLLQDFNPTKSKRRIVNSTMIALGEAEEIGREQQQEFITTDEISRKKY